MPLGLKYHLYQRNIFLVSITDGNGGAGKWGVHGFEHGRPGFHPTLTYVITLTYDLPLGYVLGAYCDTS